MKRWHHHLLLLLVALPTPLAAAAAVTPPPDHSVYWVDCDPCPPCPPIIIIVEEPALVVPAPEPAPIEEICPPAVVLQVLVPADAAPGKDVEYCLCVENRSPSAAHHVVLNNPLPAHARFARADPEPSALEPTMQWRLGSVEAGGKRIVRLWLRPTGSGDIHNCARISYEHGVCVTTKVPQAPQQPPAPEQVLPQPPRPQPAVTESVGEPRLKITKDAPKDQYMSIPIPYRITVTNEGTAPAKNVVLTDRLPGQSTFVSASDDGQHTQGTVRWTLGTLPPRATRTVELRVRAHVAGEAVNFAEVVADDGVRANAEARTTVRGAAGLVMEVVDIVDPVEVGQETQYHVILRNTGTIPITNLVVTATIPEEMGFLRAEATPQSRKLDRRAGEPERVAFEPFTLAPNADTVYRVFVRALKSGDARFRVEVSADQLTTGPVTQEESTSVFNPRSR